jgi:hypothetical protein
VLAWNAGPGIWFAGGLAGWDGVAAGLGGGVLVVWPESGLAEVTPSVGRLGGAIVGVPHPAAVKPISAATKSVTPVLMTPACPRSSSFTATTTHQQGPDN